MEATYVELVSKWARERPQRARLLVAGRAVCLQHGNGGPNDHLRRGLAHSNQMALRDLDRWAQARTRDQGRRKASWIVQTTQPITAWVPDDTEERLAQVSERDRQSRAWFHELCETIHAEKTNPERAHTYGTQNVWAWVQRTHELPEWPRQIRQWPWSLQYAAAAGPWALNQRTFVACITTGQVEDLRTLGAIGSTIITRPRTDEVEEGAVELVAGLVAEGITRPGRLPARALTEALRLSTGI